MLRAVLTGLLIGAINAIALGMAEAQEPRMVELGLPRSLSPGEAIELQVAARLPVGARLIIATERGEVLGAVTPFGVPGSIDRATATVPIPRSIIIDQQVRLRLQIQERGGLLRNPGGDEVQLNLAITPGEKRGELVSRNSSA